MVFPLEEYANLSEAELRDRISKAKSRLGEKLVILGHYYQQDAVIDFADATGDSYALAKIGAANTKAEYIVFCGVKFMAEVSYILASPKQKVYMPDPDAGCPLADMAEGDQLESAWNELSSLGIAGDIVPVTYVNSSAELKAFCGKNGGTVCTSSSAALAFDWALKRGSKVFFFPDEHLGRNTAHKKGFRDDQIVRWDPLLKMGGIDESQLREAKVIVWNGYCHVHTFFTYEYVKNAREKYPGCLIAVHPESPAEVVDASDANGSTSFLIDYVKNAPKGSTVVIGTEINLVSRLAKLYTDKKVVPLARSLCPNMFKTSLRDLCYTLERFPEDHRITVPEYIKSYAQVALERMLSLK